ncbi:MAG TPA: carbohydrate kinase family protein [Trebonia sp.]
MPYREVAVPEPGEGTPRDPGGPVALVVIGHVGVATDRTASGTTVAIGGAGYAVAAAAAALLGSQVGLVAQVGTDLGLSALRSTDLNLDGVTELPGASARFLIHQFDDGTRSFKSELGVAASPRLDLFPEAYLQARHIHLGTAPPRQQLAWLEFLRDMGCAAKISVDMFEHFVATEPQDSRAACDLADLVFVNTAEYEGLYGADSYPKSPVVLKHGAEGAEFIRDGLRHWARATPVHAVDPIGAGEVLAGVFLALHADGLPEEDALRYAVTAATTSVTEFGVDGPQRTSALALIRKELAG